MTLLRIRNTTTHDELVPIYEYLHLNAADTEKDGTASVHLGGWGRIDMGDRSTNSSSNGDLQYGFLRYNGAKNNLVGQAGRQFITEGVIHDRVDGIYLRSDLPLRFTAAAFVGSPVTTEQDGFKGGALIYGGRVAHSVPDLYTAGVSFIHNNSGGDHLREEEGIDLWLRPIKMVDIAGRSTYNSLTGGWQEHDWMATVTPLDALTISATLGSWDYRHYFHHVTTSALSLTNGILDPREELLKVGVSAAYTYKAVNVAAEYSHYDYDIQGNANYWGVGANFTAPGNVSAGLSYHRMNGSTDRLQYDQFRVYASKKFGKADLTVDFFDVNYDREVNRIENTYSLSAVAGYDVTRDVRVTGDVEFMRSAEFNQDVRGLIKVVCLFGTERRGQ